MDPTNHNPHDAPPDGAELLSAYLDGELAVEQRAQVERRLANDPAARRLLAELRAVSDSLHELPHESAPEELRDAVLQAAARPAAGGGATLIDRLPAGRSARGWMWAAAAVAASLLVMVATRQEEPAEVAKSAPEKLPAAESAEPQPLVMSAPEPSAPADASAMPSAPAMAGGGFGGGLAAREAAAARGDDADRAESLAAGDEVSDSAGRSFAAPPAPNNDAVVVRLGLRREAFSNRFVDNVLGENGIRVQPTPALLVSNFRASALRDNRDSSRGRRSGVAEERELLDPQEGSESVREKENQPLEIMLVDAPVAPVVDFVSQFNRDQFNCVSINVEGVASDVNQQPNAYNSLQQQVLDNRRVVDSLNMYSRSGVGPQQRAQAAGQYLRQQSPASKSLKSGKQAAPPVRGLAYKYRPQDELADDKSSLYSQLNQFANQALFFGRSAGAIESDDSATPESEELASDTMLGRRNGNLDRVPVILLCEPADPPPVEAAPAVER